MERVMISCKRATELLSHQMDHKLSPWQRVVLRFHLMMCRHCRQFSAQLDGLRAFSQRFLDYEGGSEGELSVKSDELSPSSDETPKKDE